MRRNPASQEPWYLNFNIILCLLSLPHENKTLHQNFGIVNRHHYSTYYSWRWHADFRMLTQYFFQKTFMVLLHISRKMQHSGRIRRCPVCNGRMEYKSFDPWTTFPKDICGRCGYSGSFAIEWENDTLMEDYHPGNFVVRKKEAYEIENYALHCIVRFFAIIAIITYLLLIALIIGTLIKWTGKQR